MPSIITHQTTTQQIATTYKFVIPIEVRDLLFSSGHYHKSVNPNGVREVRNPSSISTASDTRPRSPLPPSPFPMAHI